MVISGYIEQNAPLKHVAVYSKVSDESRAKRKMLAQSLENLADVCGNEDISYTVHEVMPSFQDWLASELLLLLASGSL